MPSSLTRSRRRPVTTFGLPGDPGIEPVEVVAHGRHGDVDILPEDEYAGVSHRSGSTSSGSSIGAAADTRGARAPRRAGATPCGVPVPRQPDDLDAPRGARDGQHVRRRRHLEERRTVGVAGEVPRGSRRSPAPRSRRRRAAAAAPYPARTRCRRTRHRGAGPSATSRSPTAACAAQARARVRPRRRVRVHHEVDDEPGVGTRRRGRRAPCRSACGRARLAGRSSQVSHHDSSAPTNDGTGHPRRTGTPA